MLKMKKRERFDTETCIPLDCWELILKHLNQDDLISFSILSKEFLRISNNLVKSVQVPNPDMLSQHLKRFKNIKTICFNNFEGHIDDAFKKLASDSEIKKLKFLNSCRTEVVDYDLLMIATCFPNLEQLAIRGGYSRLRFPLCVEALSSKFQMLRKVDFFGFHDLTNSSLRVLTVTCHLLEDVSLSFCSKLTQCGIACILLNSLNVKVLSVEHITNVSNDVDIFEGSFRRAKALAYLKLYHVDVSDRTVEAIANAKLPLKEFALVQSSECSASVLSKVLHSSKDLRKLSIVTSDANMKLLFMDQVGQNITHIDIQDSSDTTVATLSLLLTKCPSLVELRMHLNLTEAVGFSSPKQYHNIQVLSFSFSLPFLYEFSDAFVTEIGESFPKLQILELLRCNKRIEEAMDIEDEEAMDIRYCNSITRSRDIEAMLRCCRSITSKGTEAVLGCGRSIKKLKLRGYGRRMLMEADSNSRALNLEELELIDSDVDDEGFAAVAQRCCRLVSLKLTTCTNVSTEGIKHIVTKIKTLKCLELDNLNGQVDYDHILEWMLSTGNTASLRRINIPGYNFKDDQRNGFLHRGCVMFSDFN